MPRCPNVVASDPAICPAPPKRLRAGRKLRSRKTVELVAPNVEAEVNCDRPDYQERVGVTERVVGPPCGKFNSRRLPV